MALKFGDAKNLFRRNQGVKFFPGHVIRVHTSINDVDFNKKGNISLAAAPNIVEFVPDNSVASSAEVKTRLQAQPLFRGISDSIASGDLILFTSLGGVNFYIGPINSRNDLSDTSNHIPNHMRYVNPNIPKKSTERLTKKRKPFFRYGPENNWKNGLDLANRQKIEKNFRKEMLELKYL